MFICPMHAGVRQPDAGSCPKCGMKLVPEGARFALLRHMASSPRHIAVMFAVMTAAMVAAMLLIH